MVAVEHNKLLTMHKAATCQHDEKQTEYNIEIAGDIHLNMKLKRGGKDTIFKVIVGCDKQQSIVNTVVSAR